MLPLKYLLLQTVNDSCILGIIKDPLQFAYMYKLLSNQILLFIICVHRG